MTPSPKNPTPQQDTAYNMKKLFDQGQKKKKRKEKLTTNKNNKAKQNLQRVCVYFKIIPEYLFLPFF